MGGTYARTVLPAALAAATYDDANQVATFGATTFSYDANGNLTSDATNSYSWNARNEMSGISVGVSANSRRIRRASRLTACSDPPVSNR